MCQEMSSVPFRKSCKTNTSIYETFNQYEHHKIKSIKYQLKKYKTYSGHLQMLIQLGHY